MQILVSHGCTNKMAAKSRSMLLALVQQKVTSNKVDNLKNAQLLVKKAAKHGAQLISLPECFNCSQYFADHAEPIPGETSKTLSKIAKDLQIHLIGGSILETRGDKIFNTTTVFGPDGMLIGKYSKMHLFDINIPGKMVIKESEILSPGSDLVSFQVGPLKVGLGICYDMRFPELAHLYDQQGCNLLVYPSAFSTTTGPVHWHSLITARALDNQLYVAACSPARDDEATYVTWGHSTIMDPWGKAVASTEEKEDIVYAEIDADYVDTIRNQIPTHFQKREDVYQVKTLLES